MYFDYLIAKNKYYNFITLQILWEQLLRSWLAEQKVRMIVKAMHLLNATQSNKYCLLSSHIGGMYR